MADANSNCATVSRFRYFVRYLRFSPNQSKLKILGARALQELIGFYPLLSAIQHSLDTTNSDHEALKSFGEFLRLYRDLIDAVNESVSFHDLIVKRLKKSNASFDEINYSLEIFYQDLADNKIQKIAKRVSE